MRILLVEDEPAVANLIKKTIEEEQYEATVAPDGQTGWDYLTRFSYDAIIMDVMLPGINGLELCRRLRESGNQVPILMLTALGSTDNIVGGLDSGADDYLTKPVAHADLLRAIETRLRRSGQQVKREFKPDFSSPAPLLALGLTPRAAEVLLWLCQGKTNGNIALILGISESTVKKHVQEVFGKLGVETRGAATVCALEILNAQAGSPAET